MKLPESDEKNLEHVHGYLELGMFNEAWEELEKAPTEIKNSPEILKIRIQILIAAKRWEDGLNLSEGGCKTFPMDGGFFIHRAFCLHGLKRTDEAKGILLEAPEFLKKEAVYHYSLGCYETQLGNFEAADVYVKRAIQMDKKFQEIAIDDPDLEPLWASFKK